MVVRTQITLDAEVHRRAKRRASEQGISLAEYVRRAIESELGAPARRSDPSQIFDLFDSGGADVAREKERYLDSAVAGERPSRG
jgi:hypothetical protein